jgi:hypothetical protein
LNTCLYSDSYFDSGASLLQGVRTREDHFVLDVYANRVILELTLHDGKALTPASGDLVMCRSKEEFTRRKAKLFAFASTPVSNGKAAPSEIP